MKGNTMTSFNARHRAEDILPDYRGRVRGDAPSGRSAASFLPRDSSILGSSRPTHSTRHVARVNFWNVDIAMMRGKLSPSCRRTTICARFRQRRRLVDVVSHPSVPLPCWLEDRKCVGTATDVFHHWVAPNDRLNYFSFLFSFLVL